MLTPVIVQRRGKVLGKFDDFLEALPAARKMPPGCLIIRASDGQVLSRQVGAGNVSREDLLGKVVNEARAQRRRERWS